MGKITYKSGKWAEGTAWSAGGRHAPGTTTGVPDQGGKSPLHFGEREWNVLANYGDTRLACRYMVTIWWGNDIPSSWKTDGFWAQQGAVMNAAQIPRGETDFLVRVAYPADPSSTTSNPVAMGVAHDGNTWNQRHIGAGWFKRAALVGASMAMNEKPGEFFPNADAGAIKRPFLPKLHDVTRMFQRTVKENTRIAGGNRNRGQRIVTPVNECIMFYRGTASETLSGPWAEVIADEREELDGPETKDSREAHVKDKLDKEYRSKWEASLKDGEKTEETDKLCEEAGLPVGCGEEEYIAAMLQSEHAKSLLATARETTVAQGLDQLASVTAEDVASPEEAFDANALSMQCFLMRTMGNPSIGQLHKKLGREKPGTKHFEHIIPIEPGGDLKSPLAVQNLIKRRDFADAILTLSNEQISALVPTIRIFKVLYGLKGATQGAAGTDSHKPVAEYEFHFNTHYDEMTIGRITSSGVGRGAGVGVKNFKWTDKSTSPGDKGRRFVSELTLHFQSLEDLIATQNARAGDVNINPPSFLDLIIPPKKLKEQVKDSHGRKIHGSYIYEPKYFQIRCVAGWAVPNAKTKKQLNFTDTQIKAIKNTQESFWLWLNKHTLDFKPDGTVELKIDLLAAIEGQFDTSATNLFYIDAKRRQDAKDEAVKKAKDGKDDELSEEERKEVRDTVATRLRAESHNKLMDILDNRRMIRSINVKPKALGMFQWRSGDDPQNPEWKQLKLTKDGSQAEVERQQREGFDDVLCTEGTVGEVDQGGFDRQDPDAEDPADEAKKEKEEKIPTFAGDCVKLEYTFAGDIIDSACEVLKQGSNPAYKNSEIFKNIKILCGPIAYFNPFVLENYMGEQVPKLEVVNLADVPISVELFNIWYFKEVVDKGLDELSLRQFLESFIKNLLGPAIGASCFGDVGKRNRITPGFSLFCVPAPTDDPPEERVKKGVRYNVSHIKENFGTGVDFQKDTARKPVDEVEYYYYLYGICKQANRFTFPPDRKADHAQGIYHLEIGRNRGLVKNIKFKRTDFPGVAEHHLTRNDEMGFENLREPYDADVELVGNNLFLSGDLVFLNPITVGSGATAIRGDILSRLLIGGYYVVIEVENSLGVDGFSTSFSAKNLVSLDEQRQD